MVVKCGLFSLGFLFLVGLILDGVWVFVCCEGGICF